MDTNLGTAPSAVNRSPIATNGSPSHPSATRMATRRVRMLPSPGARTTTTRDDVETSGVMSRVSAFGIGVGISQIPRPVATAFASSEATFIRPDTIRSRTAGV